MSCLSLGSALLLPQLTPAPPSRKSSSAIPLSHTQGRDEPSLLCCCIKAERMSFHLMHCGVALQAKAVRHSWVSVLLVLRYTVCGFSPAARSCRCQLCSIAQPPRNAPWQWEPTEVNRRQVAGRSKCPGQSDHELLTLLMQVQILQLRLKFEADDGLASPCSLKFLAFACLPLFSFWVAPKLLVYV